MNSDRKESRKREESIVTSEQWYVGPFKIICGLVREFQNHEKSTQLCAINYDRVSVGTDVSLKCFSHVI